MNRSTDAWLSGWVNSRQPPATFRSTRPDLRPSRSLARRSHSRSALARSRSSACAITADVSGSAETKSKASSARVSCGCTSSVTVASPRPLDLDLTEGRRLLKLDLAFTVQLEDSQEANHHMDAVFAVGDQVAERRLPTLEGCEVLLDGRHRFGDRVADRRHVGQVDRRRWPEEPCSERCEGSR